MARVAWCPVCGAERADYEGRPGAHLDQCPNCGSSRNPICDMNPEYASMGEYARGYCDICREPLSDHLSPGRWNALTHSLPRADRG